LEARSRSLPAFAHALFYLQSCAVNRYPERNAEAKSAIPVTSVCWPPTSWSSKPSPVCPQPVAVVADPSMAPTPLPCAIRWLNCPSFGPISSSISSIA
jgi:hypothetical protein